MSRRLASLIAGVLLIALIATAVGLVVQWRRASDTRAEARELRDELAETREELRSLESELDAARSDADDGGNGDESGGSAAAPGGDLLGELMGGSVPGAACLAGAGAGGGGLDDLLGSGGEGDGLPDEPEALVDVVGDQVAELRGFEPADDLAVDFVDGAELGDRLDALLAEESDPETMAARERLLAALGAVPEDLDLEAVQRELLGEQVAGYYVPESGELVVRVPDDGTIRPLDRVTLAHELEHALADRRLGLPDLEALAEEDGDATLAAQALVEGDASLLMNFWMLEHLSLGEQLSGALGEDVGVAQASLEGVPHHLQRELLFPYLEGLDHVCDIYRDGGWDAVDAAYEDPPATTREVLDADRDGPATAPPDLQAPAGGSELLTDTLGAAQLLWLLEAPGGEPDRALDQPRERALAWDGGRVTAWDVDGDTAVGLSLVDAGTGPPLCATVTAWHEAAFPDRAPAQDAAAGEDTTVFTGGQATAAVRCDDEGVRFASAPDETTALAVVGAGS